MSSNKNCCAAGILAVVIAAGPVGFYLVMVCPIKRQYDDARAEIAMAALNEAQFNGATAIFLIDVRDNWKQTSRTLDGPYVTGLKLIDLEPTVSNLVDFLTYRMPAFAPLSLRRSLRPAEICAVLSQLLPVSVDNAIHVSQDRKTAMIRVTPNAVYLFEDTPEGLRDTVFHSPSCPESPQSPGTGSGKTEGK